MLTTINKQNDEIIDTSGQFKNIALVISQSFKITDKAKK